MNNDQRDGLIIGIASDVAALKKHAEEVCPIGIKNGNSIYWMKIFGTAVACAIFTVIGFFHLGTGK